MSLSYSRWLTIFQLDLSSWDMPSNRWVSARSNVQYGIPLILRPGMGVVLILSINYYLSVISRPRSPSESSKRLGVILVTLSLIINASQTVVDLFRGWNVSEILQLCSDS